MLGFIALFGLTAAQVATITTTVAVAVGSMAYQSSQAKRAQKESRESQEALATEQAKAAARARAVAQAPISAEQMQKVVQQRELNSLVDEYVRQEQQGPRVYTLPTAQPSSPVVRANEAIHRFLTGVA